MPDSHLPGDAGRLALEHLLSRRSIGALRAPVPSGSDLDLILDAGLRAPDHGRLRPWRFVVIAGEHKQAYGELIYAAAQRRGGDNAVMLGERSRDWVRRMPMIIAVGTVVKPGKIPEFEQHLSAGAAAMNMLNALHLLGYGGMWVTGANAYDAEVARALGFELPSRLVGFLAVGTPTTELPPPPRADRADHIAFWMGQAAQ
jgi:nitroreductase